MKIARFFTIFVTALFLAAPIVAADFADENFAIKIDVDTRHPTLGEELDFALTLENLHNDLDFNKIDITLWLSDEAGKRVGEKLTEDFSKLSQDSEKTFDFTWKIPADIDSSDYILNVEVEGEWQNSQEATTYLATANIEIEQPDHGLYLEEVELATSSVKAGKSIDVSVTLINIGEKDERDVKIRLDIFDLGISNEIQLTSDLLDGRDITQYLTLDIPENAKAGEYELRVKAYNGDAEDVAIKQVMVESVVAEELNKDVVILDEILIAGKGNVISLQVKNHELTTKTLTFEIDGIDWGTARVDPVAITLEAGEETVTFVHIIPDKNVSGKQSFSFAVKDGNTVLDSTDFEVTVDGESTSKLSTNILILAILAILTYFFWQRTKRE
mgnify:CR=1 FL=1